jgi:peptidoglycan/LPS O-acetylase OafA/YrhL
MLILFFLEYNFFVGGSAMEEYIFFKLLPLLYFLLFVPFYLFICLDKKKIKSVVRLITIVAMVLFIVLFFLFYICYFHYNYFNGIAYICFLMVGSLLPFYWGLYFWDNEKSKKIAIYMAISLIIIIGIVFSIIFQDDDPGRFIFYVVLGTLLLMVIPFILFYKLINYKREEC